ncbi:hypothetical protein K466DRAFT_599566 [Polyporus arcularius HHB13444]|uniref:Uncharacterized protein n=1 Tax=Polyporus arcularius HHB13444 TaxID=1314778 RepID=A0A5C3PDD6_9APHY|nr:hypothetical protein K466DRAFT_599566 [Polyporus arcularius HHB13444]
MRFAVFALVASLVASSSAAVFKRNCNDDSELFELNTCITLGPDFAGQISSFRPADCTSCIVYDDPICQSELTNVFGALDASSNPELNDRISSFSCTDFCGAA